MTCTHEKTTQIGPDRGFGGSVAVHPYTSENRAAHGNITYTVECAYCGAQREINANGLHHEYSPWGPDLEARERYARVQAERERENQRAAAAAALSAHRARVIDINRHDMSIDGKYRSVLVEADGQRKWIWLPDIEAGAGQEDNGDGLVPFYRGLLAEIGKKESEVRER